MTINPRTIAENIKKYWVIGFVIFTLANMPGCHQEINVPRQLMGAWKTISPKYMDRYIEINDKTLIFGLGNDEKVVNFIKEIEFEGNHSLRLYTFYYIDSDGEKWALSLSYYPYYKNGVFQLQNSNEIWMRLL